MQAARPPIGHPGLGRSPQPGEGLTGRAGLGVVPGKGANSHQVRGNQSPTRTVVLVALPAGRVGVAADWLIDALAGPPLVQFGLVSEAAVRLGDADRIG